MKVYVVTSGSYSDYGIEKIFFDKKKAKEYVKYHKGIYDDYRVETHDSADDYEPEMPCYQCAAQFYIQKESDTDSESPYYSTSLKKYRVGLIDCKEYRKGYTSIDYSRFYSLIILDIIRNYREEDYKDREDLLKSKVEKIGYDICAEIKYMLQIGCDVEDIREKIQKKYNEREQDNEEEL